MQSTVLPDRVTIGPEFAPRRLDLPIKLVVPEGQTMTLADGAVLDYVEVAGTLTVSRLHNTTAKVTTLVVLPTGLMDFGTKTNPIPANITVKVSIRNISIDFTQDPFQWGNGIVNFGDWTAYGAYRTPEVIIADVAAGATSITLESAPVGWQVGDELILPDLGPTLSTGLPVAPRIESAVTIAAINGLTLTLSKALDFEHQTVTGLDGRIGVQPVALNITRNVIFTSDDPVGLPGHIVNTGDDSCWDIQNTAFIGLGRTKTLPLDSTSSDLTHIGTNQIGKYCFHAHHVHMVCTFPRQLVANVFIGGGSGKWGVVIHGTSDTLVQDNIAMRFSGAGFITEDGYEVRNKFTHNIACLNLNPANTVSARTNLLNGQPGVEGVGFWHHGVMNYFDHNEAWNNSNGFNLFDFQGKTGQFPSMVDGMPDTTFQTPYTNDGPFLLCDHTLCVANVQNGLETWGIKDIGMTNSVALLPIADNYISIHNHDNVVEQSEAFSSIYLRNPIIIGNFQTGDGTPTPDIDALFWVSRAISVTIGYTVPFRLSGGYLEGCATGIYGAPNDNYIVDDTTIQCAVGLQLDFKLADGLAFDPSWHAAFTNVTFLPYGHHPPRYVMDRTGVLWDGTGPFPPALGGAAPPPPPPLPTPVWTTQVGTFQELNTTPPQFRFCTDPMNEATCFPVLKP